MDDADDDDYRRDALDERRARNAHHCLCGYPDWPGQCPGPARCPVQSQGRGCEYCGELLDADGECTPECSEAQAENAREEAAIAKAAP